jgi:polysaccharide export outer membrane protein
MGRTLFNSFGRHWRKNFFESCISGFLGLVYGNLKNCNTKQEEEMKKILLGIGVTGALIIAIYIPMPLAQQDKEVLSKKQAQAEVAADSDHYVIGSEDVLYIHVWKEEGLSKTGSVRMDGRISMPLVDDVQAAGLTPLQLKEVLTEKLKEFVELPNVTVIVMEANSFKVYISGLIRSPGVYRLRSETTLAQIISMAGGLGEWANQSKIIIIRKENGKEKRFTINYKKIVKGEDLDSNIILKPGDTIIVP